MKKIHLTNQEKSEILYDEIAKQVYGKLEEFFKFCKNSSKSNYIDEKIKYEINSIKELHRKDHETLSFILEKFLISNEKELLEKVGYTAKDVRIK